MACVSDRLKIKFKFVQFDATKADSYKKIDFSKFHLVMANFFASEIRKAKIVQSSKGFWQHMFSSMGAGKIFLVVDFADNSEAGWKYIESIIPSNAKTVISDKSLGMSCPDSKTSISALEMELDRRPKKNA